MDAGVGRQQVDDGLADGDVVVDEGQAFVFAAAAQDGDAREPEPFGPDGFAGAVGFDVDFFFLEGDEFGVDGDVRAGGGRFGFGVQDAVVFGFLVAGGVVSGCCGGCLEGGTYLMDQS